MLPEKYQDADSAKPYGYILLQILPPNMGLFPQIHPSPPPMAPGGQAPRMLALKVV